MHVPLISTSEQTTKMSNENCELIVELNFHFYDIETAITLVLKRDSINF